MENDNVKKMIDKAITEHAAKEEEERNDVKAAWGIFIVGIIIGAVLTAILVATYKNFFG